MLVGARALLVILLVSLVGCGPRTSPDRSASGQAPRTGASAAPKRLVMAIISEPTGFHPAVETQRLSLTQAGLAYFLFPGLGVLDDHKVLRATLQEAIPSTDNGMWKVLPDGRMETTHTIRQGAQWHDGTPLTPEDLRFTYTVVSDKDLPEFSTLGVDMIEKVEVVPPRSVTVTWKQAYINADALFATTDTNRTGPLPRHLLEEQYRTNKAGFMEARYWTEDFVGLGPYRLKQWARGSHIILGAFDGFALGRPKIDEIEVRFIPDPNTMIANTLSAGIDLPFGSIVGMDQATAVKEQWRDGQVFMEPGGWVVAYAQSIDPDPRVVGNVQFRRALVHAVDRQQMADTLMNGLPVADSVFSPDMPEYEATKASIMRYEYDPAKASRMVADLGYSKGPDGMFRDGSGQLLSLEVRSYAQRDIHHKTLFPLVEYWKAVGVAADPAALSAEQARDAKEQATFTAFLVLRQPHGVDRMVVFHSSQARTAERNYQGSNNGRYMNPELDALIDRFQTTIPMSDRMQVASQIVRILTEQLPTLPLFYDALPIFVPNKLTGVHPSGYMPWNVHEWDLRG